MIFANNKHGIRIRPNKSDDGFCVACGKPMIAKCGNINIHHWSHYSNSDHCDYENETQWHLWWKSLLPDENIEVMVERNGVRKITDARLNNGIHVEFQHSPISSQEIKERESHYMNMIWIFDCIEAYQEDRLNLRLSIKKNSTENYRSFRWKHAKKSISYCTKPVYLDLGNSLLRLKKINTEPPVGGYGFLGSKREMVNYLKSNCNTI